MKKTVKPEIKVDRRKYIKKSSAITGGLALNPFFEAKSAFIVGNDEIKVGLVGCGGRGTGAASQVLNTPYNVKLIALADTFRDQLDQSYQNLLEKHGSQKVLVPEAQKFTGFDAYKKVIDLVDVVLLATPPGFRPIHFEEAIKNGKHVFLEKPVATDVPGIQRIIKAGELAKAKDLKVMVGHQLRYQRYRGSRRRRN